MFPFVLDPNRFGESEQNQSFDLQRQIANMPSLSLPQQAGPQFDLKTLGFGTILSGLLGDSEGASAFLSGLMQGDLMKRQRMDQQAQMEFQKAQLEQNRQRGILQTEAEIANQKANRAMRIGERLMDRADAERKAKEAERLRAQQQLAIDQRSAEGAMARANTPEEYDQAVDFAQRVGVKLDPWRVVQRRAGLVNREKTQRRVAESKLYLPKLMQTMENGKTPESRIQAAELVYEILQNDPEHFLRVGADPAEIAQRRDAAIKAAGELRTAEKLGIAKLDDYISNKPTRDGINAANLIIKQAEAKVKGIQAKYAGERYRLENQTKAANLNRINTQIEKLKKEIATQGAKMKGGGTVTPTAELNAWSKASSKVVAAERDIRESEAMVEFWQAIRERAETDEDKKAAEEQILLYQKKGQVALANKELSIEEVQKIEQQIQKLNSRSAPQTAPSSKSAEMRKKYGY